MKKMIIVYLVSVFCLSSSVVSAETKTSVFSEEVSKRIEERKEIRKTRIEEVKTKRQELVEEKKKLREERKEKITEAKCERIRNRIQNRVEIFENAKKRRVVAYTNMQERIYKFTANANQNGYNTTLIEDDLQELDVLIQKFKTNYKTYITEFQGINNNDCGYSEGEFRGEVLNAKAQLQIVYQDAKEIREFYNTTIKTDLMALRNQNNIKVDYEVDSNE